MSITIRERTTGAVLARGDLGTHVVKYQGHLYFVPEAVDRARLLLTDRTATCAVKGTSHWVDFVGPDGGTIRHVAWVYAAPRPGHELIAGRFGFYAGARARPGRIDTTRRGFPNPPRGQAGGGNIPKILKPSGRSYAILAVTPDRAVVARWSVGSA